MQKDCLKNYSELLSEQTAKVKTDVETIRTGLKGLSIQLKGNIVDQERIAACIEKIQIDQNSFRERVQKAAYKLEIYKSILASFQS